jgi:hypothetical protein
MVTPDLLVVTCAEQEPSLPPTQRRLSRFEASLVRVIIGPQCSWNNHPWVLRMCRMSER